MAAAAGVGAVEEVALADQTKATGAPSSKTQVSIRVSRSISIFPMQITKTFTLSCSAASGTGEDLGRAASSKEGAPYPAYHDLLGSWHFPNFAFILDHVQADPYASPSKARIRIEHQHAGFPSELWKNKIR